MRIGIDLGGTKIEGLALLDDGTEAVRQRVATPRRLLRVGGYVNKFSFLSADTRKFELPTYTEKDTAKGRAWKDGYLIALAEGLRRIGDDLPPRAAAWLDSPTGGGLHVA